MLKHFTAPRMAAVEQFFQTSNNSELLGVYAWTQAVSAGLLPILGDFEVAFRNALHGALSQHYGGINTFDWMMTKPNPAVATNPTAKPLPARHKMSKRTQEDIQFVVNRISGKKGGVTPDDVVAALPFGFWEQIVNSLDHATHPAGLQTAILSRVFPFAPDLAVTPYHSQLFKTRVVSLLTRIRETRNRIGHHDSIWVIPEFDLRGNIGFIPRRPRHAVTNLKSFAERLCWFGGWVCPTIPGYIRSTDHWYSFQALLSRNALAIYRRMGGKVGTYLALLESEAPHAGRARRAIRTALPQSSFRERLRSNQYHF